LSDATKERILRAVLEIVGEGGFQTATVRAIARRAGASVSAVGYHFGSKARALAEAFAYVTDALGRAFAPLRDAGAPASVRLGRYVEALAAAVHAHGPAIAFFLGGRDGLAVPETYRSLVDAEGMSLVMKAIREITPGAREEEIRMRLVFLAGGMLYPELVPGAVGLDLADAGRRRRFTRLGVEMLVGRHQEERS
jgi:AcrR family transcriptional regulator